MQVCYNYIIESVKDLKANLAHSLTALMEIDNLSDIDVKQTFSKVTEWKKEIARIKESKTKFDKDIIGVDLSPTMINTLNTTYKELVRKLSKI